MNSWACAICVFFMRSEIVLGREMSENRGKLIGTVCSYDCASGELSIRLAGPFTLEKGDGIVFISPHSKEGQIVNEPPLLDGIILKIKTYKNFDPGARVYQTSSKSLSKKAQHIISKESIQIPIDLEIVWREGTFLAECSIEAGKWGQAFKFKSELKMEEALNNH